MLKDSAAADLENLSSLNIRDYDRLISALKLRFGDAHLTDLMHGQLHNRTQQGNEDLTKFTYDVQLLTKQELANSPIEIQDSVAAFQSVGGIADLEANCKTIQSKNFRCLRQGCRN
nr:unnamed protein product [Callosobruchus chinensis]